MLMLLLENLDTDECGNDLDNCDQNCTNTLGSYVCSCITGYDLDPDGHTCNGTYVGEPPNTFRLHNFLLLS